MASPFNPQLLKDKRILVTGGGSGLGAAMTKHFAALGAEIYICGRREEQLAQTAKEIGRAVHPIVCDIRLPDAIEAMLEEIWKNGPLDALVNNAAGNFLARSEDLSHRALDAVLAIVLHGTAYVTLACGKRWLKEGHKATVLSLLTSYAWTGSAFVLPSAMGKAGVMAMTRSLAVEWGGRGIRLNGIAPGPFPTPGAWERLMPNKSVEEAWSKRIPLGRMGKFEELANLACFMLSDMSPYINGEVVTIDGGEWLKGAGQFSFVGDLMSDSDWAAMKNKGRS
jgi:NAD(P)-dependent dehydrogenase (short-subunit alcohol dehydrogenase family)